VIAVRFAAGDPLGESPGIGRDARSQHLLATLLEKRSLP